MPAILVAVAAVMLTVALGSSRYAAGRVHEAGFWFEDVPFALSPAATEEMGGAIAATEMADLQRLARVELESAFAGLPIAITGRRDAFWRVSVTSLLPQRRRTPFPAAGETWAMGRFGGVSRVSFRVLAHAALTHAPQGATRGQIVQGIARGIGRTAVHELAHAILGPSPVMDTRDESSYEFHSFARAGQYYGELRWTEARAKLADRLRASH
ncbi:MAG: hypothetical protein FJW27_15270 [Acidimicrobiia bacterium]|nr:hypothetical protein [Acidimicrobiia bacterium]